MSVKACILLAFFCCIVRSERGRKVIKTRDLESGRNVELIEIDAQANDLCYQYTWLGVSENDNFTSGASCDDLEGDFAITYGRPVPCFHPLVYTYNDDNGQNSPNTTEIEEACQRNGCDPFCARSGGMCMKYSVTDRNRERTVRLESHFCGQGVKWGGDVVSNNRCFNEDNVEGKDHKVCFCNDGSKCNTSTNLIPQLMSIFFPFIILIIVK